jgi:hypothetical protein
MSTSRILKEIQGNVRKLSEHPGFTKWISQQSLSSDGYVAINNSFVFRDVKTVKSSQYLALPITEKGQLSKLPVIATGQKFNLDFKYFKSAALSIHDLSVEIEQEIRHLGHLVFILIGYIEDRIILSESLGHSAFDFVAWDPSLDEAVRVDKNRIILSDPYNEEEAWQRVLDIYKSSGDEVPDGLREAFGIALDKLQEQALAELHIPSIGKPPKEGVTDAIIKVLNEQRDQYSMALQHFEESNYTNSTSLNEVLRISYNFASDATNYLRLIVSICDLKPIILWGAIAEHYELSEAFRHLPWTRSRSKPSLKNYISTIADARNSTFHNLFPFRKTLAVHLPEEALQGAELRIFSEFTKKRENILTYRDKELVDVLTEFTRARERRVSPRFWIQNLKLMDATIALFSRTSQFLKILLSSK